MAGKQPSLEVFQTSPSGLPPQDDLRYLLTAEQAELRGQRGRIDSAIVTLRGIRRQFPVASELIDLGWSEVCYRARVESYTAAAIKPFVWGWSAEADCLESRIPDEVEASVQDAKELADQQVGLTSGLAIYRHMPYGEYEVAGLTNYGEEQGIYVLTSPFDVDDIMHSTVVHAQPSAREGIAQKRGVIVLSANKLAGQNWTSMAALQTALDGRFVELLQHHQID